MSAAAAEHLRPLWRTRGAKLLLGLLLVMLCARLMWEWHLSRQVRMRQQEIRRRGEPLLPADVRIGHLPDAENAYLLHVQAYRAISVDSPSSSNIEYHDYPPYPDAWHKLADASESTNAAAFTIARQARGRARARLRTTYDSSPVGFRPLNDLRHLINIVSDGAIHAHLRGDDAEAVERLLDVLHIAGSIRQDELLISQLVAIGVDAITCHRAMIIAPALRLGAGSTTRPAAEQRVRELIAALLDERGLVEHVRNALLVERVGYAEHIDAAAAGTWAIRPLGDAALLRAYGRIDSAVALLEASWPEPPSWQNVRRDNFDNGPWFAARHPDGHGPLRYSRWLSFGNVTYEAVVDRHLRRIAERRCTAIALAIALYRADHGRWPVELTELAPRYLATIPADPFVSGKPIGYVIRKGALSDGGDRPLLYFEHGIDEYLPEEPQYGWYTDSRDPPQRRPQTRQYRDLSRFIPPPRPPVIDPLAEPMVDPFAAPASEKAVEDDPSKPDAPGDDPQPDDRRQEPQAQ